MAQVLEFTVRGVALCEQLFHFVRRCARRSFDWGGGRERDVRVLVLLERTGLSPEARAHVTVHDGAMVARASGIDLDEWLAVRNAFASLTDNIARRGGA